MTRTSTRVIVRFSFEGMHRWPTAPREYLYLSYPHRHLFFIEATKDVTHNERDIEFIQLRGQMLEWCSDRMPLIQQAGAGGEEYKCSIWSCETLAQELLEVFNLSSCRAFEDNENGAEVQRILQLK